MQFQIANKLPNLVKSVSACIGYSGFSEVTTNIYTSPFAQ